MHVSGGHHMGHDYKGISAWAYACLRWRYDEECFQIVFCQNFVPVSSVSVFNLKLASKFIKCRPCDVHTPVVPCRRRRA